MPYSYEREMVPDIVYSLPNLFRVRSNYAHAEEVTEGSRIIDIVFTKFSQPSKYLENLKNYVRLFKRITTPQLHILAIIWKYKKITLNRISSLTYTNPSVILKDFIEPLVDVGLIQQIKRKTFIPTDWSDWDPGEIYTIEAKLNNWKNAINQAVDNRNRADFSYVAFPSGRLINCNYILDRAKLKGIGIIEVNPQNGSKIKIKAERVQSSKNFKRYVFNLKILSELQSDGGKWTLKMPPNSY